MESLAILKQANKELKLAKSTHTNHKELKNVLKDLKMFHNKRSWLGENALEDIISFYPISSKHNPFCNQSFNSGDCTQLMVNWKLLFTSVVSAYDDENETVKQAIKTKKEQLKP